MQSSLQVQWQVEPLKTPHPWLHCARCKVRRPFVCSDKFRVNAQKKRIDAWLINRCAQCDQIWNFPVLERCPVNAIEPALLRALTENDRALAHSHAFDLPRLGRHSSQIERFADLAIEKRPIASGADSPAFAEIAIRLRQACGLRLDRFLAGELGFPGARSYGSPTLGPWSCSRRRAACAVRSFVTVR